MFGSFFVDRRPSKRYTLLRRRGHDSCEYIFKCASQAKKKKNEVERCCVCVRRSRDSLELGRIGTVSGLITLQSLRRTILLYNRWDFFERKIK